MRKQRNTEGRRDDAKLSVYIRAWPEGTQRLITAWGNDEPNQQDSIADGVRGGVRAGMRTPHGVWLLLYSCAATLYDGRETARDAAKNNS